MVKIRDAVEADRDAVARVHADAIRHAVSDRYATAQVEAWAGVPSTQRYGDAARSGRVFVAEEGGRVVGYGQFDVATGEVEATYVLPGHQGRGVGRALLAEAERRARRAGFDSIFVSASLNALEFYAHAGFEPQVPRFYELPGGLHLECMFMIKPLVDSGARDGNGA